MKMRIDVHALVEDADDFDDSVPRQAVEDDVRTYGQLQIASVDVVNSAALPSALDDCAARSDDLAGVVFGLIVAPLLGGVPPDAFEVSAGRWREKKLAT